MTRGILIAGNESSLLSALAAEAGRRVEQYALVTIPRRAVPGASAAAAGAAPGAPPADPDKKRVDLTPWNPESCISAKTMVVGARNRLGQINDAILVCSPPALYKRPEDITPAEITALVNDQIKGWFHIVREITALFRSLGGGSLAMAVPELNPGGGKDGPGDIFGPAAAGAFRGLALGTLASAQEENFQMLGFTAPDPAAGEDARFAAFLFKALEDADRRNSGKWFKYNKPLLPFR